MNKTCAVCETDLAREPGFYLGSIYVNYGMTALLTTALYFAVFFGQWMGDTQLLILSAAFCLLFPLWFFRYARGLWLAMDLYVDPDGK